MHLPARLPFLHGGVAMLHSAAPDGPLSRSRPGSAVPRGTAPLLLAHGRASAAVAPPTTHPPKVSNAGGRNRPRKIDTIRTCEMQPRNDTVSQPTVNGWPSSLAGEATWN